MTTLTDDRSTPPRLRPPAPYFYFHMALASTAVAFLGFAPTYWLPLAHRTFLGQARSFTFTAFCSSPGPAVFAFQSWLAASGRVARHRAIGMAGVSLATAMVIFGFLVSVLCHEAIGRDRTDRCGPRLFHRPAQRNGFFAVVFASPSPTCGRPETHKRLMLLAGISLLDAAVARCFLTFLAPAGTARPAAGCRDAAAGASLPTWWLVVAVVHDGARAGGRIRSMSMAGLRSSP